MGGGSLQAAEEEDEGEEDLFLEGELQVADLADWEDQDGDVEHELESTNDDPEGGEEDAAALHGEVPEGAHGDADEDLDDRRGDDPDHVRADQPERQLAEVRGREDAAVETQDGDVGHRDGGVVEDAVHVEVEEEGGHLRVEQAGDLPADHDGGVLEPLSGEEQDEGGDNAPVIGFEAEFEERPRVESEADGEGCEAHEYAAADEDAAGIGLKVGDDVHRGGGGETIKQCCPSE